MEKQLRFKPIGLLDTEAVSASASALELSSCQLSAGVYCWGEKYRTEACVSDGFVYIRQRREFHGGSECYYVPLAMSKEISNNVREAVGLLYEWHRENVGGDFVVWGVADDMLEYCGDALTALEMQEVPLGRDWAEYLHTPENLLTMRGKRFHAKKNAVNQFLRNNSDFTYEPMCRENIGEAVEFQRRLLCGIRKFEPNEGVVHSLSVENDAIMRGFEAFDALSLAGGIIRIDGEICAYAFGGAVSPTVFSIFFEKAVKSYNGIFQVLEQEMLKKNLCGYRYINREEDLGSEGLRFAKERLRPDILLYKRAFVLPERHV